jgi:transcriptional regulator with XRE-family HTH domain
MSGRPQRPQDAPLKRDVAAGIVRDMIADGTLGPGAPVPSSAALARETGFAARTCQIAIRSLLADGTVTRGASPTARLRVARAGRAGAGDAGALRVKLSRALAAGRRAAGMTQPELAVKLGRSVTTVCHAETGRTWQARDFWLSAGLVLGDDGSLLHMYDQYKAAEADSRAEPEEDEPEEGEPEEAAGVAPREGAPARCAAPALPVSVTITPDGVLVAWPDGTETVARPPGRLLPAWAFGDESPEVRDGANESPVP